jgi:hypothetical protein
MEWNADSKGELAGVLGQVPQGQVAEIVITENGKQIKRLKVSVLKVDTPLAKRRKLGFMNIQFKSDLLEPTDPELIELFYRND